MGVMLPETLFIAALAVAVVVIVLAIRKARGRSKSLGDAIDHADGEEKQPD